MVDIQMVVAVARNGVIGVNGQIPWHLSDDLKHFKAITSGYSVVMGKNTFLSIGRVLPKRQNIMISSTFKDEVEGLEVVSDLKEALKKCTTSILMVIGGSRLYSEALPYTSTLHLTRVDRAFEGDTYFPFIDPDKFTVVSSEKHYSQELGLEYFFETLKNQDPLRFTL
jgi:dihydrofolate reductase